MPRTACEREREKRHAQRPGTLQGSTSQLPMLIQIGSGPAPAFVSLVADRTKRSRGSFVRTSSFQRICTILTSQKLSYANYNTHLPRDRPKQPRTHSSLWHSDQPTAPKNRHVSPWRKNVAHRGSTTHDFAHRSSAGIETVPSRIPGATRRPITQLSRARRLR